MTETTAPPSAAGDAPAAAPGPAGEESAAEIFEKTDLTVRALLEAGAHFGHQTHRWNPLMRPYIFGARNGTHILDLDQTLPNFNGSLDRVREAVSNGGSVLFVGTKRQAAESIKTEADRCGQFYVNNRWLGGMLTNWKTVKKSIENYKNLLAIQADEEKRADYSKKELARMSRLCQKYDKSLAGIKNMPRVPDVIFVIDVGKEAIAISEARRLGISIIGVVDSNRDPRSIDYVIPGNDDATRAIDLYCKCVADACVEGAAIRQDKLISEKESAPKSEADKVLPGTGRRVVEMTQPPRRGRGGSGSSGGGGTGGSGRTQGAGSWSDKRSSEGAAAAKTEPAKTEPAKPKPAKPKPAKKAAAKKAAADAGEASVETKSAEPVDAAPVEATPEAPEVTEAGDAAKD
jgi:small subunit ribosomal protein S2